MWTMLERVKRFISSEDGPTAVEYAVMLGLIIVVCLAAIKTIGSTANDTFETVSSQMAASTSSE